MQRIRGAAALFWPPIPGEKFAAFDALVVRAALSVVLWHLAAWFPAGTPVIRALAGAAWALNVILWATLGRTAAGRVVLPLANALWWILLVSRSGAGQSPFVLGLFLEIGLAALRLSVSGCATVTVAGALGLSAVAARDPTSAGRMLALTGSTCVLATGTMFVFMLRRLAAAPDLGKEKLRAAYLAHGIKNSLHGVAGFAELLDTDLPPDDPRHRLTQHIRAGLEEARTRLGELMAPAATPATSNGGERTELRPAAERALEACRGLLERANVHSCDCIPGGLEARICPDALHTILVNLVQNAVQAIGPQGGDLRIEAHDHPLRLVIRDTGPGIPADIRARVFEPGFTTRPEGFGLGLSAAAELTRRYGGTIRAGAAPDGGTEIEIRLRPVAARHSIAANQG